MQMAAVENLFYSIHRENDMSEVKPGEQIHLGIKQIDAEDLVIMDLEVRWYGFDNESANETVTDLIETINNRTREYSKLKNK